jgi:hypothetical protein
MEVGVALNFLQFLWRAEWLANCAVAVFGFSQLKSANPSFRQRYYSAEFGLMVT